VITFVAGSVIFGSFIYGNVLEVFLSRKRKNPLCFISLKREIVCYEPQRGKEDKQKYIFNEHSKFAAGSHGGLELRLWPRVLLLP
jgi:hypothetical protein